MEQKQFVFTNETPYLIEEITPSQYLRITKFVSQNELNFVMAPSLGFKVIGEYNHDGFRSFVSLMQGNQIRADVVDTELIYAVRRNSPIRIEMVNEIPERVFSIVMLYTINEYNWQK